MKIRKADFMFPDDEWEHISDEAKDLISWLLDVDPETRLDYEGIISHPWIQAIAAMDESDDDTDSQMSMEEVDTPKDGYEIDDM